MAGPFGSWSEGHRNFESVDSMNETIINRFNEFVKPEDVVYHLGDVIMGANVPTNLPLIMARLNCKNIHLIFGNHDKHIREKPELQKLFMSVNSEFFGKLGGKYFHMYHAPLGVWYDIGKGCINLFGHSHSSYTRTLGRQMDVGVDGNNYYPYHIDDIIKRMSKIDPVQVDHHSNLTNYN